MMRDYMKKISVILLTLVTAIGLLTPVNTYAATREDQYLSNRTLTVDGTDYTIKTIDYNYADNTFVSLRDMAAALKDTGSSFGLVCDGNDGIAINTGGVYEVAEGDLEGFTDDIQGAYHDMYYKRPDFTIDDRDVKYYCVVTSIAGHELDCYMNLVDFGMALNVAISKDDADHIIIDSSKPYSISMNDLETSGYMDSYSGLAVGDATTGELYYSYNGDEPQAIASTTKLMNYLICRDSIEAGSYSMDSSVTADEEVEILSESADGTFDMPAGSSGTVREMMLCMLLPSSNEAALALAKHDAGSEEAFVEKMNAKARALGMTSATFYNCNGLPVYTDDAVPVKKQNTVSAEDMFTLASYIVNTYPDFSEITSVKKTVISSYNQEIKNINPLLYNIEAVDGMKTGATARAGSCLVTSMKVSSGGEEHYIIAVELGAEGNETQARTSELLVRYGRQQFYQRFGSDDGTTSGAVDVPDTAEAVAARVLNYLKSR